MLIAQNELRYLGAFYKTMNKVWTMCKNKDVIYIYGNPVVNTSITLFPLCHFFKNNSAFINLE